MWGMWAQKIYEKKPGAGPGEENEAKNVLVMQGDMKIQVPSEGYP